MNVGRYRAAVPPCVATSAARAPPAAAIRCPFFAHRRYGLLRRHPRSGMSAPT